MVCWLMSQVRVWVDNWWRCTTESAWRRRADRRRAVSWRRTGASLTPVASDQARIELGVPASGPPGAPPCKRKPTQILFCMRGSEPLRLRLLKRGRSSKRKGWTSRGLWSNATHCARNSTRKLKMIVRIKMMPRDLRRDTSPVGAPLNIQGMGKVP